MQFCQKNNIHITSLISVIQIEITSHHKNVSFFKYVMHISSLISVIQIEITSHHKNVSFFTSKSCFRITVHNPQNESL